MEESPSIFSPDPAMLAGAGFAHFANPVFILVSVKKLRFWIAPRFVVGAASSRDLLTVAAGCRSYKNDAFHP
jgi:hypothetical protein